MSCGTHLNCSGQGDYEREEGEVDSSNGFFSGSDKMNVPDAAGQDPIGQDSIGPRVWAWFRSLPIMTLVTAAVAIGLSLVSAWEVAMSYQRQAILQGEVWRLLTGHLTHWNADHLVWDVMMFLILAGLVERRNRRTAARLMLGSAFFISLALWSTAPQVTEYRGLSGIDSALFVYAAAVLAGDAWIAGRRAAAGLFGLLLAGFVGKVGYEMATGATLFVDSSSGAFTPLPSVHLVGAAVGLALAAIESRFTRRSLPRPRTLGLVPDRGRRGNVAGV